MQAQVPSLLELPDFAPTAPVAVLVPQSAALGEPSTTGVRTYNQRTYLNLDSNETILAVYDAATGDYRERLPHALHASGPVLHPVPGSSTWSRLAPGTSLSTASVPLPSVRVTGRLDLRWALADYQVHGPAGHATPSIAGKRCFSTPSGDYCFDQAGLPKSDVEKIDAQGNRKFCGKIEENAVIQIHGEMLRSYLLLDGSVCRSGFDSVRSMRTVCADTSTGLPDIYIETGSRIGAWVPELRIDAITDIIRDARRLLGYTPDGGSMAVGGMSESNRNTYCYLRQYARQLIAFNTPSISSAPALEQGRLIDAHIWQHGYPYDTLRAAVAAKANAQTLHVGLPQFDAFQGMGLVSSTREGGFNINAVAASDQLHYPVRSRTPELDVLLNEWRALDKRDPTRGAKNEQLYRVFLASEGYRIIPGGNYRGGQSGFDLVFEGPTDAVYLLEVKHVSTSRSGRFSNVNMARVNPDFQMEDGWINFTLRTEAGRSEAGRRVQQAMRDNRLFKVIGATTPEGRLLLFLVDMRPVRL
ncbi:hypothetical protein DYL59_08010 [Pseudomonas kairouanensis]|uniref:Uncharacterized protein n=1 Tax=Pseudomonas kairouanensis TaxID=2293832 RepID=A0A4Z0AUV6_9PSED|nr:hypothetical protein DYL59_08010 [Pseudomonas kairouanensis]